MCVRSVEPITSDLMITGIELYKKAQFRQALDIFVDNLNTIKQVFPQENYILTLELIANCHINLSEFDKAVDYLKETADLYEKMGNRERLALALSKLGNSLNASGNPTDAIQYLNKAIELNREQSKLQEVASNLLSLSIIQSDMKQYSKSLSHLKGALEIFESYNDIENQIMCINNMGNNYLEQSQLLDAEKNFERAMELARKHDNKRGIAMGMINLGICPTKKG